MVPKRGTRPTSDKVREALFSMINNFVEDAHCLDLFAGSGALGLEALSRGAHEATFVDNDLMACRTITENLENLGLEGQVVHGDSVQRLRFLEVDLVLADPPYGFEAWNQLLEVAGNALIVAESDTRPQP